MTETDHSLLCFPLSVLSELMSVFPIVQRLIHVVLRRQRSFRRLMFYTPVRHALSAAAPCVYKWRP